MAVPFMSLEAAARQGKMTPEALPAHASPHSLLFANAYEQDRDDYRECDRRYREAYEHIERDRQKLDDADNDRDYRRRQRALERDYQRLEDLRNQYSECDYGGDERNQEYRNDRDYDSDYREYHNNGDNYDYREYRTDRNYRD